MFIVNDIELLERLKKYKLLNYLTNSCVIAVSGFKLSDYSLQITRAVNEEQSISVINVEKEGFDDWISGRRTLLALGDLSSIYLALTTPGSTLVLSADDEFLKEEATVCKARYLGFDDFFVNTIKDERVIQFYNLIKAA